MSEKWKSFTKEELELFVKTSHNKKELAQKIGYKSTSSYIKPINNMIKFYSFDISHFKGIKNQDLTGQVYGKLTVIKLIKNENKRDTCWLCKCECGNEIVVQQNNLKSGNTTSCGCKRKYTIRQKQGIDHTGEMIGYWKILGIDEERSKNGTYWRALCTLCNKTIRSIPQTSFSRNASLSCGCHLSSLKTKIIEDFLDKNNINYSKEFTFPDLVSDSNVKLRFDYAVFDNKQLIALIEYQGSQHFIPNYSWGGEEGLIKQQKNDQLKRNYCQKHNIKLIEYDYKLTTEQMQLKLKVDFNDFFRK